MPPRLEVGVDDPDGDSLTVTFHGRSLVPSAGPDFTLIEIPDTQHYTSFLYGGSPAIFLSQTQWIVSNRGPRNIVYVAHVGDIVQNGGNGGDPSEWILADACMKPLENPETTLLEDGIPFGVSAGNHDLGSDGADFYNQYFGVSRFNGRGYYAGHRSDDNQNWFDLFSAGGLDFVVFGMGIESVPDPRSVAWADSLLTVHANRRAIVVSHHLLDPGPPPTFSAQGQAIYDGLKHHPNLFLMICGHNVNEARRADTFDGHTVHTVMANYQNLPFGGNGWLRIMEFSPANNQIRMRTYSPWLNQYRVTPDSSAQFALDYEMGGGGGFRPIRTLSGVPAGSTVSIPWVGLRHDQTLEWYVEVSDGSSTVSGPAWQFTTLEGTPPTVQVSSPNGGETLGGGDYVSIQWSATDASGVASIDLFLSRNGAHGPWETLASGIPNSGSYSWRVTAPGTSNAFLRVVARDAFSNDATDTSDGAFQIDAPVTAVGQVPLDRAALEPVAPNPSRGPSRIGIVLPEPARIRLDILDVAGRRVAALQDGFEPAGRHEFDWDGRHAYGPAPAGLYFARLQASGRVLTRRFAVTR